MSGVPIATPSRRKKKTLIYFPKEHRAHGVRVGGKASRRGGEGRGDPSCYYRVSVCVGFYIKRRPEAQATILPPSPPPLQSHTGVTMAATSSQHPGRLVALYIVCALATVAYAGSCGGAFTDGCYKDVIAKRSNGTDPNMPDPGRFYALDLAPAIDTPIRISLLQCQYICHRHWRYRSPLLV